MERRKLAQRYDKGHSPRRRKEDHCSLMLAGVDETAGHRILQACSTAKLPRCIKITSAAEWEQPYNACHFSGQEHQSMKGSLYMSFYACASREQHSAYSKPIAF